MAREIYMPSVTDASEDAVATSKKNDSRKYTVEETNEIYKKFFKGFNAFRGHPELQELLEAIEQYMKELKIYNT